MENGEKAVLALQFGVLFAVVIVIGNFIPAQTQQPVPSLKAVYWGQPGSGSAIPEGGTLHATSNQSSIYAYFTLPPSTSVSSVSATRLCIDPKTRGGESRSFDTVRFGYNQTSSQEYFILTPTGQKGGWSCTYTISVGDSIGQVAKWSGAVSLG